MNNPLSTDLDSPSSTPYFLWDEPMTVGELRQKLASASDEESIRLLGKILREARDRDVWKFTTPRGASSGGSCSNSGPRKVCLIRARLSNLQSDFLREFFGREHDFYLTGGAALAEFYLGHRETDDLDLFTLEDE